MERRPERGNGTEPHFFPRQLEFLKLAATGLCFREIADRMGIAEDIVKTFSGQVNRVLGVRSTSQAVFKGVKIGLVDLDEVAKELNLNFARSLSPRQLEVLRVMTSGSFEGTRDMAKALETKELALKKYFGTIYDTVGIGNRVQVGILYLAAQKKGIIQSAS